ncbi:hypothetical protein CVT24_013030 [Panaeolus cyanescens]|uniref:Uncharacterized protein n=1 Tax=Panaeolus cyanescens TaxID=181874 RepID=A0A409YUI8_9AGAR|nr:hypothetical protein CVT24_013030 [Panaeolus cyanescens]
MSGIATGTYEISFVGQGTPRRALGLNDNQEIVVLPPDSEPVKWEIQSGGSGFATLTVHGQAVGPGGRGVHRREGPMHVWLLQPSTSGDSYEVRLNMAETSGWVVNEPLSDDGNAVITIGDPATPLSFQRVSN